MQSTAENGEIQYSHFAGGFDNGQPTFCCLGQTAEGEPKDYLSCC